MERLRSQKDLRRVFGEGRRYYSPDAVLHARERAGGGPVAPGPRLAVVAGRRFRTAIERNRVRRTLREASRVLLREVQEPWDVVLVARRNALSTTYKTRLCALAQMFRNAGILEAKADIAR